MPAWSAGDGRAGTDDQKQWERVTMAVLEKFNERMVSEATLFRLIKSAGAGPIGADAMSYDLCQLDVDNPANFTVCYHIQDVRDDMAVQIAEAFIAGRRWGSESNTPKST